MPDVTDMTTTALKVARKKAKPSAKQLKNSAEQLKKPGGLATVGAALIALPYAAEGIAKLKGGSSNGNGSSGSSGIAERAKQKVSEKAKGVAGEVADEKL